jgi:hypothetical protein
MISKADEAPAPLFAELHPNTFRVFSGSARWFYAELLEHLNDALFIEGAMVPRSDVIEAIRGFIDKTTCVVADDDDTEFLSAPSNIARAHITLRRLMETGWMVEHRDHARRYIDLDATARILLDNLLDIKHQRLRSYGGEVLQILTNLEAAKADWANRSESVRMAARAAKSFLNHLRSVGSAMRRAEDMIVRQKGLHALFHQFFNEFVSKHLIEDFQRLHTKTNPFRFRVRILEMINDIENDTLLLTALGTAYANEGRANSPDHGVEVVSEDLRVILRVFQELDTYLDVIQDTNRRVEKRIRNTIRFMDSIAETKTEQIVTTFRSLAATDLSMDADIPVHSNALPYDLPRGPENLYKAIVRRPPIKAKPISRTPPDPVYEAYMAAIQDYRTRATITPVRVIDFLERAMGDKREIMASKLPVKNLDDFFAFERLPNLEYMDGGTLAKFYRVEFSRQEVDNGWLIFSDFKIIRNVET